MKTIVTNSTIQKVIFIVFAIFCITPYASSPMALVAGFLVAIFSGNLFARQVPKYIHLLLQIAIIGLGFGLKLDEALEVSKSGFLLTISSVSFVLIVGYFLGKVFKLDRVLSYLISVGTAICGGSAIAAVAPIVKPSSKQISVALTVVFTLNSVALIVYPSIGSWLGLSQEQFGLWCAVGIHDTSSVVGAANKYGEEALKIATTVKLARALWIIPVCLMTIFVFKSTTSKIKIPWFIGGFILAILLNTYTFFSDFNAYILPVAKMALHLTLFMIGTTLSLETLRCIGLKPLFYSLILWILVSVGSLLVILFGNF